MKEFDASPVVLCHGAATGGSLVYRMIVAQFGMAGVSEVTHCYQHESGRFIPTDPEYSLLDGKIITLEEFAAVFMDRILNSIQLATAKNKRLLIREHSHSYFFNHPGLITDLKYPSWIVSQLLKMAYFRPKCIVSVRDPVDSWLGLKANLAPDDFMEFREYCERYRAFIELCESRDSSDSILIVKYEELVEDPETVLRSIGEFIGEEFGTSLRKDWCKISSSGKSGRQSDKLKLRRRRPFDHGLLMTAQDSEEYDYLTKSLGYPRIDESATTWHRIRSRFVPFYRAIIAPVVWSVSKLNYWLAKYSRY